MVRFSLTGVASAQLPLRVLGLFAQRDIAVEGFDLSRHDDRYWISVTVAALTASASDILLEKIRVMVEVDSAAVERIATGGA